MPVKIFQLGAGITECINIIREMNPGGSSVLVGLAGGSCAGKSYIAGKVALAVGGTCFPMDDYYVGRDRMPDDNFDNPGAIEFPLLRDHLELLKQNRSIAKPVYNFARSQRVGDEAFSTGRVIIVEGLFALQELLRPGYDLKVFVEASEVVRFNRRLERDTTVRGIPRPKVVRQWQGGVWPSHGKWVEPQKEYADLIIENN